ncbi:hypothetical protein PISL3812_03930 [Talaromyces islandicus]|uniref:Alpha/beta hydrolase fold-3 domain-containing protein n=1 Tax=Talaromyces islandicus TaxID=28573 RepID=A0A0U1LU27_TALIS|nr:hypothetical protein PISL3812_03930 [Talaromyces islandicus]
MSDTGYTGFEVCHADLQDFVKTMQPFKLQGLNAIQSHRDEVNKKDTAESVLNQYGEHDGSSMTHEIVPLEGASLSVFTPTTECPTGGRPCLYFIHGGGFVTNNMYSGISSIIPCIKELNAVCVSIDYGLAPEVTAADRVDQCYTGLLKVWELYGKQGQINMKKIAVIGRSAGAALLVGLNLKLRQQNEINIRCNVMSFPMVDNACNSASHAKFRNAPHLTHETAKSFWEAHLSGAGEGDKYAIPEKATIDDLKGFPPTLVEVAAGDVLHDEGVEFYNKLGSAGVNAALASFPGFHCFDGTKTELANKAKENRLMYLKEQEVDPIS